MISPWKESQKQRHYFADKVPCSQSYRFAHSHVQMWELDPKEVWALKNWCSWTVMLDKTLASSLDCKEIKPINPKGNQSWVFIERTDAETEAPILWLPDAKNRLTGKDPDASMEDWRQEEKGKAEDEMVGWHHQLNGLSLSKLVDMVKDGKPGVLQTMGHKELDTTEWTTTKTKLRKGGFFLGWELTRHNFNTTFNDLL